MLENYELVTIYGIDYVVDYKLEEFRSIMNPEIVIPFESVQGKEWCKELGIEHCETCGEYYNGFCIACPRCEHMLLCE